MFILLAIILVLSAVPARAATGVDQTFGKINLSFERNVGQMNPRVKFLARGPGYSVFLTGDETIMRMSPNSSTVRMKFLGQNRNPRVDGVNALAGTTNYLVGDPASHRTNIVSYQRVRYSAIYPGIDVEYHASGRLLEYDFIVQPGSSPEKIRIGFSGIHGASVNSGGDLVLKTDGGDLVQKKPQVYQDIDGSRRAVDGAYIVRRGHVGFQVAAYDKTRPLVIDPELIFSTYFGGTGTEAPSGIAVDSQGAVYVVGSTTSTDFPTQSAAQSVNKGGSTEAFVFKLDPKGTQIVYSTFIGGSGTDEGHAIAVDAGGNAYVTGYTQSNDFPIVNGFQKTRAGEQEAYVLKLNSSGTAIVYSTFMGGSLDDRGTGIAVDAANNIYVTGVTGSTNFPVANAFQRNSAGGFADGFVAKLDAGGGLVYSSYVGGVGNDNPLGIAVDGAGAAYVTGWTTSINFPLANAFQSKFGGHDQPVGTDDVFVFKLNPSGAALDYSTYIGGTGSDEGTRIAVDSSGSAYVTGVTGSIDFPTVRPYQTLLNGLQGLDAFVAKLAPDGKSLVFSTYFGGFQNESGTGIAVDAGGAVYFSGQTNSFDLPNANGTQNFIGGDRDAFVAKLDAGGNILVFSTFLGSTGTEAATGLALDSAGDVYVTGFTTSETGIQTEKALQTASAGGQDVFVAKLTVQDIVSSSTFEVAPQGATSVVTKGTRSDSVFGYAVANPVTPGTQLTGLAIINRVQAGASVSQVGIPVPPAMQSGRLFVDVSTSGRSVLSLANPSDQDATVDFFYTDSAGTTSQFANTTVKAHQHFSRFVTDDPLLIFAPGTLNFTSSIPLVATAFFTDTNESSELLISRTPIVDPIAYSQTVMGKTITIPELAEGGGWKNDVVLVNTSEDRMNGEVRFFSQGTASEPGAPMEIGVGTDNTQASVLEFDIPPRGFQRISTTGAGTISENPFSLTAATSITTPGAGTFQTTGFASADSVNQQERLNGLQIIEYRQLGITQSQTGIVAPSLRQNGRFFAETSDSVRSIMSIVNPTAEDITVDFSLTDKDGTSTDPVTLTIPANAAVTQPLADAPINLATGNQRSVTFTASAPLFITPLRFFTNERGDSLLSSIPIGEVIASNAPIVIPHFADGLGWKTKVVLVNTTDEEIQGEIHFVSPGSATDRVQHVTVGVDSGDDAIFPYTIKPRSFFLLQTNGLFGNMSTGSVRIIPYPGFHAPAAHEIVSNFFADLAASEIAGTLQGTTLFQTTIDGLKPASTMRFYGEALGNFGAIEHKSTATAIAIANPSGFPVDVVLKATSFDKVQLAVSAPITIPADGQFGAFLSQIPGLEALAMPFRGIVTLTVPSGAGVTATSFRVMFNERPDMLLTTTGPLNEDAGIAGHVIFPYMADSTGYTTQFILMTPPGAPNSSGVIRYHAVDGSPLQIDVLRLGSVQVLPFGGFNTPHVHMVMQHRDGGVLTTIVGVEGEVPAGTFRMYAESKGEFASGTAGSTQTGVALANPSAANSTVVLEVRSLDGVLLRTSQPIQVPASGQVALFLNSVPGFESLTEFEGVLSVVAKSPQGVTATAFRASNNERGNILYTGTGPLFENATTNDQLIFGHIAEGGGYTTQFIVIGGVSGKGNAGVLSFFNEEGNPLNLTLESR